MERITSQTQDFPDDSHIQALKRMARKEKNDVLNEKVKIVKNALAAKTKRALELASEKGTAT